MSTGNQDVWERIQRFYNATKRPVFVYVGYSADAAAACHIVTALLKNNLVPFSVQPMMTMREVAAVVRRSQQDDADEEAALFLLIGVGATSSLRDIFDSARHVVILLDNHRPVHLNNMRDEGVLGGPEAAEPWLCMWQREAVTAEVDRFFLNETRRRAKKRKRFNQRTVARRELRRRRSEAERGEERADKPPKGKTTQGSKKKREQADHGDDNTQEVLNDPEDVYEEEGEEDAGAASGSDDEGAASVGSSDEEEEASNSSDDEGDDGDSIDDEDDDYEAAEDDDDDVVPTSQQVDWRTSASDDALPADTRELYYSTACCGTSVAQEALDVSLRIGRSRDIFLWFAAVGVTDLFLRSATDYSSYLLGMTKIRDHIALLTSARLRTTTAAQQSTSDGFGTKLSLADEPQLLLLRHWTLWASVWHGKWTAGLLRLHHVDRGEETLKELFARCGISSRVAQQSWTEASADTRNAAVQLVCQELANLELLRGAEHNTMAHGAGIGVDDIEDRLSDNSAPVQYGSYRRANHQATIPCIKHPNVVPTVTRSTGFGTGVSALDVCHLFRGVLCAPLQLTTQNSANLDALQAALAEHHKLVFWRAHDVLALDPNTSEFSDALDDAKRLQSSVVTATSALMQRGVILSTRALHHTILSDPSRRSGMMDSFWAPLRLQYLAEHVAVALTMERGRRWEMRPLALCCAWPLRDASNGGTGGAAHLQVALAHSGAVNGPNRPLSVVAAWNNVVAAQVAEDAASVDVDPLLPLTCRVRGRDTASHLMESLYLRCAENTRTLPLAKESF